MKRFASVLALISFLPCVPLRAEEPQLDFVRRLRSSGKADLALRYLEEKSQGFPADLSALVPLELALTRLDLAATQPDATSRAALYEHAQIELERFLKNSPKHQLAPEAALGLARIAALRGRAQFSQASREETRDAQRSEMLRARGQFEEAARRLQTARTQIDEQLKTPASENVNETLREAQLQVELEQGINLLDQAKTYTESSELGQRGTLIKRARDEIFDKLAKQEPKTSFSWEALAWVGRCHFVDDDPKRARKVYMEVINAEAGEQAETGRRLGRYFRIQALGKDADPKKASADIVNAAEEWLRLYPKYANTPEGYGVRFELANAYRQQAQALGKSSSLAREKYENAQKQYQVLEQSDNDYTAVARENRLNIVLLTSLDRTKGDISKLRDFEECYLRAELERAKLAQTKKELSGEKLELQRKQHFGSIVEALNRGLDLADAKSSAEEVNQARLLLVYAYLALGDYYRAAVAGEELAHTQPKFGQAAMAGAYALSAYSQLVAKQEQAGTSKEDLDVERKRQRQLALYIEQTWPASQAADIARHVLGALFLADKDYAQAVEALDRISPSYSDATRSLHELAEAALAAQKNEVKPEPGKPSYRERALAALAKIPDLKPGADGLTGRDYFAAKLTLADIFYREKDHDKLEALAQSLTKSLDIADGKTQEEFRIPILSLSLYAKLGRGEMDCNAGRYGKAYELVAPIVKELNDPAKASQLAELKEKNPQLLRAVLGLALRASVQDNKIDQGRQILDLTQKMFPENAIEILVQLVQQLRSQIEELRRQGASGGEQLKKTVTNFSTFLDELTKQQERNAKPEMTLFLGQSYSSLDKHGKAAELFSMIKEDAPPAMYHLARILYVRELRLGRDFAKAEAALKDVLASEWGKQHLEARKESILLLEDQEKYQLSRTQGAIPEWNQLMLSLQPQLQDNRIKEQYFDCYYHLTYCILQNALKKSDKKQKEKEIRAAASFVARLEEQPDAGVEVCKKRLHELMEKEPLLKEAYRALKTTSTNGKK